MKITAYIKVPNSNSQTILGSAPAFNLIQQLDDEQIDVIRDKGQIRFTAKKRLNYDATGYVPKGCLVTIVCYDPSLLPDSSSVISTDNKVADPDPVKEKNDPDHDTAGYGPEIREVAK